MSDGLTYLLSSVRLGSHFSPQGHWQKCSLTKRSYKPTGHRGEEKTFLSRKTEKTEDEALEWAAREVGSHCPWCHSRNVQMLWWGMWVSGKRWWEVMVGLDGRGSFFQPWWSYEVKCIWVRMKRAMKLTFPLSPESSEGHLCPTFIQRKGAIIYSRGCLLVADSCNFSLYPEKFFPLWWPGKEKAVEGRVQTERQGCSGAVYSISFLVHRSFMSINMLMGIWTKPHISMFKHSFFLFISDSKAICCLLDIIPPPTFLPIILKVKNEALFHQKMYLWIWKLRVSTFLSRKWGNTQQTTTQVHTHTYYFSFLSHVRIARLLHRTQSSSHPIYTFIWNKTLIP